VKSRNSRQCNEALLVMTVRTGKKFGFQSAAKNLQRQRRPDRLRQTAPDRCSSRWKGAGKDMYTVDLDLVGYPMVFADLA